MNTYNDIRVMLDDVGIKNVVVDNLLHYEVGDIEGVIQYDPVEEDYIFHCISVDEYPISFFFSSIWNMNIHKDVWKLHYSTNTDAAKIKKVRICLK